MKYNNKVNQLPLRKKLIQKYGARCFYCKTKFIYYSDIHIDHLIPQVSKGSDDIENLRPACIFCNSKKWSYHPERWKEIINKEISMLEPKLKQLKKIAKTLKDL